MAKKKIWDFEIRPSRNKAKKYIKIIAGNGEPFLAGQMLKEKRSAIKSIQSLIDAIKEDRFRIIANPIKKKKK